MGVVYRARHQALDQDRALKLVAADLAADDEFRSRFLRESRLAASVDHPNVIPVHHAGEEDGQPYISMRVVEGPDLGSMVEREGPLEARRVADLVRQVAAGLEAAHGMGLVHKDVKPANVLVEARRGAEHAFLTDFGISDVDEIRREERRTGDFLGTPDYVSPEQVEDGPVDRRADVYSLAAVAYFLLTGQEPFPNRSEPAKLLAHAKADRPRPSSLAPRLSRAVDSVIARGMAIEPARRYASAPEFATELERALGFGEGDKRATLRRLIVVGGMLAAAAGAALAFVAGGKDDAGNESPSADSAARVAARIPVGSRPVSIGMGELKVWVANADGTVRGIDPESDRADSPTQIGADSSPVSVAVGFGSIWVLDRSNEALVRLDPGEGTEPLVIPVGPSPADVEVGRQSLWVANEGDGTLSRVDPGTNSVSGEVLVGGSPRAIAYGSGQLWVVDAQNGWVTRVRKVEDQERPPRQRVEVGTRPVDVAVASGRAWVVDRRSDELYVVDPRAERLVERFASVGVNPMGVAAGGDSIWVANRGDGTVSRIDPEGRREWSPVSVGRLLAGVTVGRGSVWALDSAAGRVARLRPDADDP